MESIERLQTEVLVIGGGGAGVRAAIEADNQGAEVCLVSKGPVSRSGITPLAYPSYQAAFGTLDSRDSPEVHFQDTVMFGRHLGDQDLARVLADESMPRALDLERYGVGFKKEGEKFYQVHHPGQTYPRNLFILGGGFGLISGLRKELHRHAKIKILEDLCVSRLFKGRDGIAGVMGLNLRDGRFYAVEARAVVLACGGYEELWGNSDTAPDSTGDGVALALGAGAEVIDLEMALYYPTVLAHPESVRGVLVQYETILGEEYLGFKLRNGEGKEFLPPGPLPVRDVLMRAMFREVEEGRGTSHGAVVIDPKGSSRTAREIDDLVNTLLKGPAQNLQKMGIDIRRDRIEVVPAVHYCLGGVHINERTETSVPGLFAAGENASSVHGANRISGNALAETQVFGARAGKFAAAWVKTAGIIPLTQNALQDAMQQWNAFRQGKKGGLRPIALRKEMKEIMDRHLGPNRNEAGMKKAMERIRDLRKNALPEVQVGGGRVFNVDWRSAVELAMSLDLAERVVRAALFRKETRGHHFRSDFPETLGEAQHTAVLTQGDQWEIAYRPVRKVDPGGGGRRET